MQPGRLNISMHMICTWACTNGTTNWFEKQILYIIVRNNIIVLERRLECVFTTICVQYSTLLV